MKTSDHLESARIALDTLKDAGQRPLRIEEVGKVQSAMMALLGDALEAHRALADERRDHAHTMADLAGMPASTPPAVEPGQSADDERLMALGRWVASAAERAEQALATLTGDSAFAPEPHVLELLVTGFQALQSPLPSTDPLLKELGRLTVWRRAIDHWQAQQPTAEPDKPAE